MNMSKYTLALLLPLTASAPLLASMIDDETVPAQHHYSFERTYSAAQYEHFLKTAHLSSPTYPSSCISSSSRNEFLRYAFYYGITSLESTDSMRATSQDSRFGLYKIAVALVNITTSNNFSLVFDEPRKRGNTLYKLLNIIEKIILPDLSENRNTPNAKQLRYPLQLSRLILRSGHFEDLLDIHQRYVGFSFERRNRWMTCLWDDLTALKGDSRTVVIETLMAKMILEHNYTPEGIADPLRLANRLLLENHTHSSGRNSSSSYVRGEPEISHLTTRTTLMSTERSALRDLLHQKQEVAREASSPEDLLSPDSADSALSNSMEICTPDNTEHFAFDGSSLFTFNNMDPLFKSNNQSSSYRHTRGSREPDLLTDALLGKIKTAGFSSNLSSMGEGDNDFLMQVTLEEIGRHFLIENFDPVQAIQNYRAVFSSDPRSDEDLVRKMVPIILAN